MLNERAAGGRAFMRLRAVIVSGLVILLAVLAAGCKASGDNSTPTVPVVINPVDYDPPAGTPPAPKVNSKRAFELGGQFVAQGPRALGTAGHQKAEDFIHAHLAGLVVEDDAFTAQTAAGAFPVRNIIAKLPGKKDGIIVIAGHYDTPLPLKDKNFVGANDGGSNVGVMLAYAEQFKGQTLDGYSIWLLFTDAEEATVEWTDADSVYGSKHLAARWQQDGTAKKIKAFLLLDMIGDKDLGTERDSNSTQWLLDVIGRAAARLGYSKYFYVRENMISDDHLPFAKVGIPVADIIDLDYGFDNLYHHTTEDTMDKLSPQSLQIVGDTVLETVRALNTH